MIQTRAMPLEQEDRRIDVLLLEFVKPGPPFVELVRILDLPCHARSITLGLYPCKNRDRAEVAGTPVQLFILLSDGYGGGRVTDWTREGRRLEEAERITRSYGERRAYGRNGVV